MQKATLQIKLLSIYRSRQIRHTESVRFGIPKLLDLVSSIPNLLSSVQPIPNLLDSVNNPYLAILQNTTIKPELLYRLDQSPDTNYTMTHDIETRHGLQ